MDEGRSCQLAACAALRHLQLVSPIAAPVQRLERGLLHRTPRRHQPAGPLHDGVLAARHEDRRAPAGAVAGKRQINRISR